MITKNRLILILGLWIVFMAVLGGFPSPYEEILYVLSGLAVSTLSFMIARQKRIARRHGPRKERVNEVFAQAAPSRVRPSREEVVASDVTTHGEDTIPSEISSVSDADSTPSTEEGVEDITPEQVEARDEKESTLS